MISTSSTYEGPHSQPGRISRDSSLNCFDFWTLRSPVTRHPSPPLSTKHLPTASPEQTRGLGYGGWHATRCGCGWGWLDCGDWCHDDILAAHVAIFMGFGVLWRTSDVTWGGSSWAVDDTAGANPNSPTHGRVFKQLRIGFYTFILFCSDFRVCEWHCNNNNNNVRTWDPIVGMAGDILEWNAAISGGPECPLPTHLPVGLGLFRTCTVCCHPPYVTSLSLHSPHSLVNQSPIFLGCYRRSLPTSCFLVPLIGYLSPFSFNFFRVLLNGDR